MSSPDTLYKITAAEDEKRETAKCLLPDSNPYTYFSNLSENRKNAIPTLHHPFDHLQYVARLNDLTLPFLTDFFFFPVATFVSAAPVPSVDVELREDMVSVLIDYYTAIGKLMIIITGARCPA